MSEAAKALAEFHGVLGQKYGSVDFESPDADRTVALRSNLHREETKELTSALLGHDLSEVAGELADVVYVAYGTAHLLGIPLDAVLAEVHRANMAKFVDGKPILRRDGKVLKPEGWKPADVEGVLAREEAGSLAQVDDEGYEYFTGQFTCSVWRFVPGKEGGEVQVIPNSGVWEPARLLRSWFNGRTPLTEPPGSAR